ncbi:MAG: hypothetical protein B0D96_03900 [Candidatus Sedimenticola endophacoides]|uniref:YknX-like C-terminal permuted SH3-like domain-containing protein n=1 Tax=Candidatus Sedimenticola endophacoides TaxID=2548426 RepID=A0A657PL17_9GAMM|nr:MAG: hypothetical protein B0D94_08240 [Candidatus Sedimenticola endophacoides]OQX36406.1 MAG: hypothetical protein B0D84_01485 [Candidatus Sedimenticola endophacoides]OQX36561.1 MAG: hypothetical protein B0D96_03900 [Candidatus Sedimenticola endophacoides]OQX41551.1 MAG: hypothetical protein B0D89_03695 [Candidatus Sedimenticola endophacoides]OQX44064.1 MAG: hypothetical protein B0D88_03230 [Candidatus Sedimenticola endophacoides]
MKSSTLLLGLSLLLPGALPGAQPAPAPAKVAVASVEEREYAESSRLSGVIDFDRISEVSGEVSGLITEQLAVEGSLVRQGDPLVRLNSDLILKDMDIKRREQAQVGADIQNVGGSLKRLERLLKNNSASRQAYDEALFDLQALEQKRATLGQQLQRLELQLEKSTVRAPFDGLVLAKLKERGEWLTPGSPVCRLASTADVIAKIAISESLVRYQRPGGSVGISIESMDREFEGRTLGFSPVADLRSKSALLKIGLPYESGMIQNMTVSAEIPSGARRTLRMVPRDALVRIEGQDFVYTIEENTAKMVPVEIAVRNGEFLGVSEPPLRAGMLVVVDGNDRLRPDQPVTVVTR